MFCHMPFMFCHLSSMFCHLPSMFCYSTSVFWNLRCKEKLFFAASWPLLCGKGKMWQYCSKFYVILAAKCSVAVTATMLWFVFRYCWSPRFTTSPFFCLQIRQLRFSLRFQWLLPAARYHHSSRLCPSRPAVAFLSPPLLPHPRRISLSLPILLTFTLPVQRRLFSLPVQHCHHRGWWHQAWRLHPSQVPTFFSASR